MNGMGNDKRKKIDDEMKYKIVEPHYAIAFFLPTLQ